MENFEKKYYFDMYIREGEFHIDRGKSSAIQCNYYTAKNEFLIANKYFSMAVNIAKELDNFSLISHANSLIYMCEAEILRLKEHQR